MKHFMFTFAMLLCSLVAFADNDVGKYEVKTYDLPVVTDVAVYCPIDVYEFINYDYCAMCTVVEFQNRVPSPKSYPIPHFMLYDVRNIHTTATTITNWRHRAFGEISMNLRYTNSTYKR